MNDTKYVLEEVIEFFNSAIEKNEVSHAYLFSGGNFKLRLNTAYQIAALLNCKEDIKKEPCGECSSCVKILNNNHPDLIIVEPEGASIKISTVRNLQKKLGYKKYEAKYKVVIIVEANKMTPEASNCLLKVLEEPLDSTVFLLLAENRQNLISTIISRCQNVYLGLQENFNQMDDFDQYLLKIINGNKIQMLEISAELEKKDSDDIKLFLINLLYWFRDMVVWKNTDSKELLINREWFETLKEYDISLKKCLLVMDKILETQKMIDSNANKQLALECLLLDIIPSS